MKTFKISIFAFLIILFVSSCAKDRTCVFTDDGGNTTETEYENVTKRWMKNSARCVTYKVTPESGNSYEVECEIE